MPYIDPSKFQRPATNVRISIVIGLAALVLVIVALLIHHVVSYATGENLMVDTSASSSTMSTSESPRSVYVYLTGCVAEPGLYELEEGSRVADVIESAGGFTEDAATNKINLARPIADGEQIDVLSNDDATDHTSSEEAPSNTGQPAGPVNINSANEAQLDTLPGVGPSVAAKIIASREAEGPFTSKEDLQRVSGIGPKKYAELEAYICI